jgi:hypothetical protein
MRRGLYVAVVAWALCSLAAGSVAPPAAHAQDAAHGVATGTVSGVVSDPSGARIPHAAVHLSGAGPAQDIATDALGRFSITAPGGNYQLTVSAPGFAASTRDITIVASEGPSRLSIALAIAPREDAITVPIEGSDSTAGADNASALVFRGAQLKIFSDDDTTFQKELLALAGGDGSRPPQLFVDGFSGTRLPPKSSILSVRINRNPYSAMYESLGFGRVEVSTRPGGEQLHGQFNVNSTDNVFNSQNPYLTAEPPYYLLNLDGNVSGSFNKKTSFFLNGVFNDQQNNAALNAVTLNTLNQPVAYSAAVRDPQLASTYGLRIDRTLSPTNTLTDRYEFNQVNLTNGGLTAPLTTVDQAFNSGTTTQTLQLSDTQILGPHIVSESHAQYLRTRLQQNALNNTATLLVEGGFNGGGNPSQSQRDNQDRFELQEALSIDRGAHYLRFGARYRLQRDANLSTANYNGQWVFPSLAALQNKSSSQFSITTGQPSAAILTGDLAAYAEDEWKVTPSITLDLGFRLESQSAIPDHLDPAPRIGAAWALHRPGQKSAWMVLRAGVGLFYDRFSAANLLTAIRQNGVSQQTFTLSNPPNYPNLPSTATLTASPPTIYRVSPNLQSESGWSGGLTAEKTFGKIGTASVNYVAVRGVHQWGSANINAPLPGTYNPGVPGSGVRPFGGTQNIYEFDSNGIQKTHVVFFNTRLNVSKRITAFLSYSIIHSKEDAVNATTFASNSYKLSQDYGRAPQPTQLLFTGASVQLPFGIGSNLFISTQGGTPFNITTGTDLNGDSIYNDRPAFATAPTANSILYNTRFGSFDANPQPGEKIIPFDYGNSPNFAFLDLSLNRAIKFGPRPAAETAPAGKPAAPRADPAYSLTFTADASNLLNHRNPGQPVGVLGSPLFGQSVELNNPFTANTAANRVIFLQTSFSF